VQRLRTEPALSEIEGSAPGSREAAFKSSNALHVWLGPGRRREPTERSPLAFQAVRSSALMEKLVVEDGCRQPEGVLGIVNRVLDTDQPPLAKYIAVLLSGDFFGHLEDQFHQRIRRQLLRAVKQYARLADVLDHALVPGAEIFPAVSNRKVRSQAPCPWYPGRLLLTGAASDGRGIRHRFVDPISAAHGLPVVLVSGRAHQADLVKLSVSRAARP